MQTRGLLLYSIFGSHQFRNCQAFSAVRIPAQRSFGFISPNHPHTSTAFTYSTLSLKSSNESIDTMSSSDNDNQATKQSANVRIVSYNILSSELADPEFFTKCKPEHLDASARLPKILDKLQTEIDTSPNNSPVVFCLQEVSHDWATGLHIFFAERGYHMVTGLYGKKFNGYMGIALAYPTKAFKTLKVDLVRLSEKKSKGWPRKPRDPEPGVLRKYVFNPVYNPMKAAYRYYRPKKREQQDAWDYSKWRFNQFVAVKLQNRCEDEAASTPFWVGNYHMPCAFRTPAVMNIHADLVGCRIQKLAGDDPYVLAGDFNILPDSPHYSLLKTGELSTDDETYPDEKYNMNWKPELKGMRSAYFEHNSKEPEFTNNAHNGAMNAESFIGTLDYIFLSDEWKVEDVKDTPKQDELEGVYPDAEEPSDHVVIAASLKI